MNDTIQEKCHQMVQMLEPDLEKIRSRVFIVRCFLAMTLAYAAIDALDLWSDYQRPALQRSDSMFMIFQLLASAAIFWNFMILRARMKKLRIAHRHFKALGDASFPTVSIIDHHLDQAGAAINRL